MNQPTSLPDCRVRIDPAATGASNMAADEALLAAAVECGKTAIRWYQWSEPTISLGYFQDDARISLPIHLRELPVIKRITGGGAILHHHELTYACAIPAAHPLAREPRKLYVAVHEQIAAVLGKFDITVKMRGESYHEKNAEFLCFARGDAFDLVYGDHKIAGSAQRRRKGAILQHGSLILCRSKFAPQFPGLFDVAGREIAISTLINALTEGVSL